MRGFRPIACLLLVYQALFLNVWLPGHTRGALTLDGRHAAACCCGGGGSRPVGEGPATPTRRDREQCAVCGFAAGITSVPVVRFAMADLGPVDLLADPPPAARPLTELLPTYDACGPPLSADRA